MVGAWVRVSRCRADSVRDSVRSMVEKGREVGDLSALVPGLVDL